MSVSGEKTNRAVIFLYVSWLGKDHMSRGGRDRDGDMAGEKKRGQEVSMEHWYRQWKKVTVHPNLRVDYFENIGTKQKAYWLGFLYADGYLVKTGRKGEPQIGILLSRKDEKQIDKFCENLGLDSARKSYRIIEGTRRIGILFRCQRMSNDLMKHGVTFRKSKIIQYPKTSLPTRELELAFLLGYYDGDGIQNRTIITSGSRRFLEQIRNRFGLRYMVRKETCVKRICDRTIVGTRYLMSLGPEQFNELMNNHTNSMPRKRRLFCDSKERARRSAEASTPEKVRVRNELLKEWRSITREELEKLVQEIPFRQIAIKYNLSPRAGVGTVSRKCRRFGVSIPTKGYWQKIRWARKSLEAHSKQD